MTAENEEELVQRAVERINEILSNELYGRSKDWLEAWRRYDLKWSETSPRYVTIPEKNVGELVAQARRERDTFELACYVIGTRLAAEAVLPLELRIFAAEVLRGELTCPKGKAGRKSEFWRNFVIIEAMIEVNPGILFDGEDHLNPTARVYQREVRARHLSAGEIVRKAIEKTTMSNVTQKVINDVWPPDADVECWSEKWSSSKSRVEHFAIKSLLLGVVLDDLPEECCGDDAGVCDRI